MFELLDTSPSVNVQESEYRRLLGYPPGHQMSGRPAELALQAREWYMHHGRPWTYARQSEPLDLDEGSVRMEGAVFSSPLLHARLKKAGAGSAILVAVSAGPECEEKARELWLQEKPDEYYFLEVYGSAVVEHLVAAAGFRLCEWADRERLAVVPHYSPGYPGWEIGDQHKLLDAIRARSGAPLPSELTVLSTGMLRPKKSLLAVFGLTRHIASVQRLPELIPCEQCSLPSCRYRRTAYRRFLPRIEDVGSFQGRRDDTADPPPVRPRLNTRAAYTINARALRKWSEERLEVHIQEDRSVRARFRYEGTTCTNLGRPLEFDYHVTLDSSGGEYRIAETTCVPAPGHDGYTSMCEYTKSSGALMSAIAAEKPLLGQSLDAVLGWVRPYSPSGCYCDARSRDHKWGLVLEVLHYALAQRELRAGNG